VLLPVCWFILASSTVISEAESDRRTTDGFCNNAGGSDNGSWEGDTEGEEVNSVTTGFECTMCRVPGRLAPSKKPCVKMDEEPAARCRSVVNRGVRGVSAPGR
jgi:hypothetical protein